MSKIENYTDTDARKRVKRIRQALPETLDKIMWQLSDRAGYIDMYDEFFDFSMTFRLWHKKPEEDDFLLEYHGDGQNITESRKLKDDDFDPAETLISAMEHMIDSITVEQYYLEQAHKDVQHAYTYTQA